MLVTTKNYREFLVGDSKVADAALIRPALSGDTVSFDGSRVTEVLVRADHTNLVGVLELASKTRYGFTKRGAPIYLFVPWNEAYPPFYVGSTHKDTEKNVLAVINFDSWAPDANLPRGDCRRILGPCGSLEVEEAALLIHACPKSWKQTGLPALAPAVSADLPFLDKGTTFHVDPPGCKDIDDAITFVQVSPTEYDVHIHIADVANVLAANSWLVPNAAGLGQSLYRDGQVVAGLFPQAVEEATSLLPGHRRSSLSLVVRWIRERNDFTFVKYPPTWVHEEIEVKESYTYESILESRHAPLLKEFAGDLSFKKTDDPHEWIAEIMLFYNRQAAAVLKKAGKGLLRRHSAPDMNLLSRLEGFDGSVPTFLAYASGEYCDAASPDTKHWGLDIEYYCHASSPIRRFADCVNQTALFRALFQYNIAELHAAPTALNILAKRAKTYERDLFFIRTLLQGNLAETKIHGIILDDDDGLTHRKVRIWVKAWGRIISVKQPLEWKFKPTAGMFVNLALFFDATQRNWKRRMVFRMSPNTFNI